MSVSTLAGLFELCCVIPNENAVYLYISLWDCSQQKQIFKTARQSAYNNISQSKILHKFDFSTRLKSALYIIRRILLDVYFWHSFFFKVKKMANHLLGWY